MLYADGVPVEDMSPGTLILFELCFSGFAVCILFSGIYAAAEFIEWLAVNTAYLANRRFGARINEKQESLATRGITIFKKNVRIDTRNFWDRELSLTEVAVDILCLVIFMLIFDILLMAIGLADPESVIALAQLIVLMAFCLALGSVWKRIKTKIKRRSAE